MEMIYVLVNSIVLGSLSLAYCCTVCCDERQLMIIPENLDAGLRGLRGCIFTKKGLTTFSILFFISNVGIGTITCEIQEISK